MLARLERIEALDRSGAPAAAVLAELRGLVAEAEEWARREGAGAEAALAALERCAPRLEEQGAPTRVG